LPLATGAAASGPAYTSGRGEVRRRLSNNDGNTWVTLDVTNLATTIAPSANSMAIGGNVELFPSSAGYNLRLQAEVEDQQPGGGGLIVYAAAGGRAPFSPSPHRPVLLARPRSHPGFQVGPSARRWPGLTRAVRARL